MKRAIRMALALGLALPAAVAGATVSEEETARLGTELTPVGADPGSRWGRSR